VRRIGRLWRELRPDRNPLRRACDRAEAGLLAALLAVFLVAVLLAAVICGVRAYGAGLRVERADRPPGARFRLSCWRAPATEGLTGTS
jgi:hypothetical protein